MINALANGPQDTQSHPFLSGCPFFGAEEDRARRLETGGSVPGVVQRVPESEAASETEVVEAIQALTTAQLAKLEGYGRYRVFSVGLGAARGRTARDLLGDAMIATLDGTRSWRKGTVDFSTHLIGAMRSIASHWNEEPETADSTLVRKDQEDERDTPIETTAGPALDLDGRLDAASFGRRLEEYFKDDALALEIIDGLKAGMPRHEIREVLSLSEQEYDTVRKRISRGVDRLMSEGGKS